MKIQYQSDELIILESSLFRTTSTIIISEKSILLVDPNWLPIEIDFIANLIDKLGKGKAKHLLFTHSDYDHIIGYGRFKDFNTIASQNFIDNPDKGSILSQIKIFDDENYILRDYDISFPEIKTGITLDGQSLKINSDEYLFWQAKGHNIDGLITFNKTKGILIVGDYLSNIEFPYIYDSGKNYKDTLNKLEHIISTEHVKFLISGHGDFTTDIVEIQLRIKESRDYIHELESSVKNDTDFDLAKLFRRYQFPSIMRQFHEGNAALLRKER
ncbi:MAG: hydroxyacylglutathione hydrolase [Arcticibacterium sp.]|jgi:hydroxyacylglutathione hydrolase